jgi:hypothetical protein
MSEYCFWILNDGTIVKPDSRHILAVASCPVAFGETDQSLQITFRKYGQSPKSNYEGSAREEVLMRVILRNHIRIRKNQHKRGQHWSFQLFKLTEERKQKIAEWASYITPQTDDKFGDVIIHQFCDNSKKRTSLDQLAGEHPSGDVEIVLQDELVRKYSWQK